MPISIVESWFSECADPLETPTSDKSPPVRSPTENAPGADAALGEALLLIDRLHDQVQGDRARIAVLAMYADVVRSCHAKQDPELLNAPKAVRMLAARWGIARPSQWPGGRSAA